LQGKLKLKRQFKMKGTVELKRRDSSVSIGALYGLDDRGSRFRFPAGAGNYSLRHRVHNCSGTHPASYQMGTGGKAAGA
jgi:hypothetical protein